MIHTTEKHGDMSLVVYFAFVNTDLIRLSFAHTHMHTFLCGWLFTNSSGYILNYGVLTISCTGSCKLVVDRIYVACMRMCAYLGNFTNTQVNTYIPVNHRLRKGRSQSDVY